MSADYFTRITKPIEITEPSVSIPIISHNTPINHIETIMQQNPNELLITQCQQSLHKQIASLEQDYKSRVDSVTQYHENQMRKLEILQSAYQKIINNSKSNDEELSSAYKTLFDATDKLTKVLQNNHSKELKSMGEDLEKSISHVKLETSNLQQSLIRSTMLDEIMNKITNPTHEMELLAAMVLLVNFDKSYCTDDDDLSKPSSELMVNYLTNLANKTGIYTQKLFEEVIIENAKQVLFKKLTRDFGNKIYKFDVEAKNQNAPKFTDTHISHSYNITAYLFNNV